MIFILHNMVTSFLYFFTKDNNIAAYIAIDTDDINGRNKLIRMQNISGPKGSITALIVFAISYFKIKLVIDKNEGLTFEGFRWLIRLIQANGRGLKLTDQNGDQLDVNKLTQEYEDSKQSPNFEKTSIYIDEGINRKVEMHYDILAMLPPYNRYLRDDRID